MKRLFVPGFRYDEIELQQPIESIDYIQSQDLSLQGIGQYISDQITVPTYLFGHSLGYLLSKYVASINNNVKCIINIDGKDRTYDEKRIYQPPKSKNPWDSLKYYTQFYDNILDNIKLNIPVYVIRISRHNNYIYPLEYKVTVIESTNHYLHHDYPNIFTDDYDIGLQEYQLVIKCQQPFKQLFTDFGEEVVIVDKKSLFGEKHGGEKRGGDFSQSRVKQLNELMKNNNITSMEITYINNNKLQSWYFNCDQGNRFNFAGMGMLIFAYYVLKYVDIDLTQPLYNIYPDMLQLFAPGLDQNKAKQITGQMCLQHSTGLPNGKKDFYEFINITTKKPTVPGEQFQYSSMGFELLQKVIEYMNREPIEESMQKTILKVLELDNTSYITQPDKWHIPTYSILGREFKPQLFKEPEVYWSMQSTAYDYAQFLVSIDPSIFQEHIPTTIPGVQQYFGVSKIGDYFWSYGNNGRSQSFFIYDGKDGVVYCTNNQNGLQIRDDIFKIMNIDIDTKKLNDMIGSEKLSDEFIATMKVFIENGFDEGIEKVKDWTKDELQKLRLYLRKELLPSEHSANDSVTMKLGKYILSK